MPTRAPVHPGAVGTLQHGARDERGRARGLDDGPSRRKVRDGGAGAHLFLVRPVRALLFAAACGGRRPEVGLGGRLVRRLLRRERVVGVEEVLEQLLDHEPAEVQADDDPHQVRLLGVRRQAVGRHDPAVLAQARRQVVDVETGVTLEREGHHRLRQARIEDLELAAVDQALVEEPRIGEHRLDDRGVAAAAEAHEVVQLGLDHGRAAREVERERRLGAAEVVDAEDEILGQLRSVAEDQPADARVDEAVLVPGRVDRGHLLEAEVELEVRLGERGDERTTSAVDVQRHVPALLLLDPHEQVVDLLDRVRLADVRGAEHCTDGDRVLVDERLDVLVR